MKARKSIILLVIFIFAASLSFADDMDTTRKVWKGRLNVNTSSEADFSILPGIGNITAHRIVKFREEIGGFKAVSELKRVKGISDGLFLQLEPNLTLFEKSDLKVLVDINSAGEEALKKLPGMSAKEANSIIEYRKRNEGFDKVEELLLAGIEKKQYEEIRDLVTILPYVTTKKIP
ncbi:MAG: helix-hairpin-helix domain pair protein [Deltaproteobacteria bacterium]|nr:helix-hairpin-helix domain pair protein [Deltaproteobacteria bacterium]